MDPWGNALCVPTTWKGRGENSRWLSVLLNDCINSFYTVIAPAKGVLHYNFSADGQVDL